MKNILYIQRVRKAFAALLPVRLPVLLPVLLAWVIFFGSPALAAPQVSLEAPATVARGDAFLALAVSSEAVPGFSFNWMGKNYTATALPVASAAGAVPRWQAIILLPVPLDAKESDLTLGVSLAAGQGGGKKAGAAGQAATQGIRLYDKARPEQKLTVDKK